MNPDIQIVPRTLYDREDLEPWTCIGIEVKSGVPVEKITKLRTDCLYVNIPYRTITQVCFGREIAN